MATGVLLDAFKLKPAAAIAYLKAKGNAYSWNWYDTWQDAHARSFTVAKAMQADVLQSIRDEVTRALEDGRTLAQFKKDLTPRLKALGWWGKGVDKEGKEVQLGSPYRLRTIYQTNIQTAYQAGHYKQAMDVAQRRPWWRYEAVNDAKTRPAHKALHGKVFRYDDPAWDHIMPPNGFGCRCGFSTRSDRELARDGITPESSEGKIVEREVVIRGNDGKPIPVTVHGIKTTTRDGQPITMWTDPGWDYNPGEAAFQPDLRRYDDNIAKKLKAALTGGSP